MKILCADDDKDLLALIAFTLSQAGYLVVRAGDGPSAIRAFESEAPDLVLLDINMPGASGFQVCEAIRTQSRVPVMMLTVRGEEEDLVRALELGADDYMTKPFWPEELIERVRARIRRPTLQRGDALELGTLRVDLATRGVLVDGGAIELTRVEFDLLAALARRPGVAVTRGWLVEHVLDPDREGSERTLDVHVSRLRKKLGTSVKVETVWGIGYRLAAEAS
jgi:DNA-binding response OmpR family regulator